MVLDDLRFHLRRGLDLSALAFVIAMMAWLAAEEPMKRIVAPLHFHDLGKLLLALVMLWSTSRFRST